MPISVRDRKLLWGRSGNRCAFPDCGRELVIEVTLTSVSEAVGEECHIVARRDDGPRGESLLTADERDRYDNLILLCADHHKVVDRDEVNFTPEKLREMRESHNTRVRSSLDPRDASTFEHELQYAI